MNTKTCFKCHQEKPLDDFYKHSEMADGHLNKCKECTKKDVHENYIDKREYYAEYERQRNQEPERKRLHGVYRIRRRKNNPLKYKAHNAVNNAVRDGRLEKQPCEVCKDQKVEAHHEDYSKPLDVHWLCFKHHRERHGQVVSPF